MSAELGIYAAGFTSWRRAIAAAPEAERFTVFYNACAEVADYVLDNNSSLARLHSRLYGLASAWRILPPDAFREVPDFLRDVRPVRQAVRGGFRVRERMHEGGRAGWG